jgi:hypothetical protein
MIYDEFDIIPLEPVKYQIAEVNVISKAYKKTPAYRRKSNIRHVKGGAVNSLYKYCIIAIMALIMFTAINIIGFGDFMENLEQVISNRSYNFFTHPEFV